MPAQLATAPAKALDGILHGPSSATSSDITLLDYRHKATFTNLWLNGLETATPTINGTTLDWTDDTKQIFLIGNDPPDGVFDTKLPGLAGINFRSHFTATSWLAAWKVKFTPSVKERPEGKSEPMARIAVIDPRVTGQANGAARALQTILGARDAGGNTLVPRAMVLNAPSLDEICQWLHDSKTDHRVVAKESPHLPDLLKSTIWNALTSTSEIHHAISNILGPLILSGKQEDPNLCPETLLRRLLSACGLVSWRDSSPPAQVEGDQQAQTAGASESEEEGKDLQILLVDDQAEQGWTDWVKECLPGASAEMKTLKEPTSLVDAISGALGVTEGQLTRKDARFQLNLPGVDKAANPVLLLDLRLFNGKPEVERTFYREQLLPLVNHFTDKENLAWPGFSSTDRAFKQAREKVEQNKLEIDTDQYREVLTWLPRVVALADMSLPIVLFSSTGRRDLVEPLKTQANIFTGFEKPRLIDLRSESDSVANLRLSAKSRLREAVSLARKWLQCRAAGARISGTDLGPLKKARKSFEGKSHFEIYHDESGRVEGAYFRVTSLLAGFTSINEANGYDRNFPIKFYGLGCQPKRAEAQDLITELHGDLEVDRWENVIWNTIRPAAPPLLLSVCARDPNTVRKGNPDSIFDPEGLDNINWDLLSLSWESLLADLLPSLLKGREANEQITIQIYGATRLRPVPLSGNSATEAISNANNLLMRFREEWGLDLLWSCHVRDEQDNWVSYLDRIHHRLDINDRYYKNGRQFTFYWRSLREDSFWKLVAEVLFGRKDCPGFYQISNAVKSARGVTLTYGEQNAPPPGTRHLHYLADVGGCLVDVDLRQKTVRPIAKPFDSPCARGSVAFRERLMSILNANRLLDASDCEAEAFVAFESLDHSHPCDLAYLSVLERLKDCLDSIVGSDMTRMCLLFGTTPGWLASNRTQVPDRIAKTPAQNGLCAAKNSPGDVSAQLSKWKLRRFLNTQAYLEAGVDWHKRPAYHVRVASNGKITVFADLTVVPGTDLSPDFVEPVKTSFTKEGGLLGKAWSP